MPPKKGVPPQQDEWHLFERKDDWLSKTERDFDFSSVESTEIPLNNVAAKMQSLVIFAPQKFLSKCHQVIVILFRALSTTVHPFILFHPKTQNVHFDQIIPVVIQSIIFECQDVLGLEHRFKNTLAGWHILLYTFSPEDDFQ